MKDGHGDHTEHMEEHEKHMEEHEKDKDQDGEGGR
jgi:hypothetical protein